jgi:hypothetical protein
MNLCHFVFKLMPIAPFMRLSIILFVFDKIYPNALTSYNEPCFETNSVFWWSYTFSVV